MDNCITCESRTECTSCIDGFIINNNLCHKINNNDNNNDDDGLGIGVTLGIIFGCIGFVLLVIGIVYFLWKKVFNKNNNQDNAESVKNFANNDAINIDGNEKVEIVKVEKNVDNEKVVVFPKRRSIHNG